MTTVTFAEAVARIAAANIFDDLLGGAGDLLGGAGDLLDGAGDLLDGAGDLLDGAADLLGGAGGDPAPARSATGDPVAATEHTERAEHAYRQWAKIVHPDGVSAARSATATRAFAKLSGLFEGRQRRIVKTPKGEYRVGAKVAQGDIADLSALDDDVALLKVPRSPADNDLMAAEAAALRQLHDRGDPKYRPYAPRLIESFTYEDPRRIRRTVNIIERQNGFVPLTRITATIDPRDGAWIWRRLLVGLGWAHRAGVIHGAVLEEHVLIHPREHGLVLVDWCYSGNRPTAIVAKRRDAYPPEVLNEKTATTATDIYMATGLMQRLIEMPEPMRRFADGCRYTAPRMRPQDAWSLLGEFDELLHHLYGPRTFRPFTL